MNVLDNPACPPHTQEHLRVRARGSREVEGPTLRKTGEIGVPSFEQYRLITITNIPCSLHSQQKLFDFAHPCSRRQEALRHVRHALAPVWVCGDVRTFLCVRVCVCVCVCVCVRGGGGGQDVPGTYLAALTRPQRRWAAKSSYTHAAKWAENDRQNEAATSRKKQHEK